MSDNIPVAPVTEIDEDSAYTEANDSLRVLLSHGKSQSVETNASGPVGVGAEAGAGGGMQVENDIGDLDETQVMEHSSERDTEGSVAKDMLMRCAEDAACEATSEMKAITSQGARPAGGGTGRGHGRKGCSLSGETRGLGEGSLRVSRQQNQQSLRIQDARTMEDAREQMDGKKYKPMTKRLQSSKRNTVFGWRCKEMPTRDGSTAWPTKT